MDIVYIETTFISLLVADPSRDLITAANQQATRDWWDQRRQSFECITSDEVLREANRGDQEQVRRRLEVIYSMSIVRMTSESESLATLFMNTGALPQRARSDAAHLAIATTAMSDFLITWNCRHLANAQILRTLRREAARVGWELPVVCTPPELMADFSQ